MEKFETSRYQSVICTSSDCKCQRFIEWRVENGEIKNRKVHFLFVCDIHKHLEPVVQKFILRKNVQRERIEWKVVGRTIKPTYVKVSLEDEERIEVNPSDLASISHILNAPSIVETANAKVITSYVLIPESDETSCLALENALIDEDQLKMGVLKEILSEVGATKENVDKVELSFDKDRNVVVALDPDIATKKSAIISRLGKFGGKVKIG